MSSQTPKNHASGPSDEVEPRRRRKQPPMRWRQWPAELYRSSGEPIKRIAFRLSILAVLGVFALALGGVGALIGPALGETSEAGFWAGASAAVLIYLLSIALLFTVGRDSWLRHWIARRS